MSLLRHLIQTPPVLNQVALEQALTAMATDSRRLGEPHGVFESRVRAEIGRPLHKTGWENKQLTALQDTARTIFFYIPAFPEQEQR
jgi:hypothetical protein